MRRVTLLVRQLPGQSKILREAMRALPAAIAAALGSQARVICMTGDGGLGINTAELETAARTGANVTVLVFNDGSLSLIKAKQQHKGVASHGVDYGPIDWVAVAEGFGVNARRITTQHELERGLEETAALYGPVLLDIALDPSVYSQVLAAIRG